MSNRRNRKGLTLLELMIVLIILVGLMAMVGPRLLGSQEKADINTTKVQIGSLEKALKMYKVNMKRFPSTEDGLELLTSPPEDERLAKKWEGPYIDGDLPLDPWGNAFEYEYDSEDTGAAGSTDNESVPEFPRISSAGPDGQSGTDDDIANRPADGEEVETDEPAAGTGNNT